MHQDPMEEEEDEDEDEDEGANLAKTNKNRYFAARPHCVCDDRG